MSTEDDLDTNGDNNVSAVRLVDVQPLGRHLEEFEEEILETSVIDDMAFEEIVDDENSNIGSVVSIQSVEDSAGLIMSDLIVGEETEGRCEEEEVTTSPVLNQHSLERWPTLEILPINLTNDNDQRDAITNEKKDTEMIYVCAKCSEQFTNLDNLVQHVKLHKDQAKTKISKDSDVSKLLPQEQELVMVKRKRMELDRKYQQKKIKVYSSHETNESSKKDIRENENETEKRESKRTKEIIVQTVR